MPKTCDHGNVIDPPAGLNCVHCLAQGQGRITRAEWDQLMRSPIGSPPQGENYIVPNFVMEKLLAHVAATLGPALPTRDYCERCGMPGDRHFYFCSRTPAVF